MDSEKLENLFSAFNSQRNTMNTSGVGLGLNITK